MPTGTQVSVTAAIPVTVADSVAVDSKERTMQTTTSNVAAAESEMCRRNRDRPESAEQAMDVEFRSMLRQVIREELGQLSKNVAKPPAMTSVVTSASTTARLSATTVVKPVVGAAKKPVTLSATLTAAGGTKEL